MIGRGLIRFVMSILVFSAAQSGVAAERSELTARFTPLSPKARLGAPIPGIWELSYSGGELLEGRLEAVIDINFSKQHFSVTDIVLSSGKNTFRGMLPAADVRIYNQQDVIQATLSMKFFTTDGREIKLDAQPLMLPGMQRRSFVIAQGDASSGGASSLDLLTKALRFEQFNSNPNQKIISTLAARVTPQNLPVEPIGYCSFDLLFLADEAFADVDNKRLKAISQWVRAGGSLCVLPGIALAPRHIAFLNQTAKSGKSQIIFVTDADGHAAASGLPDKTPFALFRVGLGRVAIGLGDATTERDINSPAWREMSTFLWKITEPHRQSIIETGGWRDDRLPQFYRNQVGQVVNITPGQRGDLNGQMSTNQAMFAPIQSSDWTNEMTGQLMPKKFRFVPLWLIGLLLVFFVAAIGPVDYLILGALKMRRMTWIVFPLTAFGFAYLTVWVANTYMGVTNETHAYEFLDIGDNDEIVRASRFELHYNGAARHSEIAVSRGLFTGFDTFSSPYSRGNRSNVATYLSGRMPQRYTAVQDIPQWTPQLNRTFWIAPDKQLAPPVKFAWDSLQTKNFQSRGGRESARIQLQKAFGKEAAIYVYHLKQRDRLAQNPSLMNNPHGNQFNQNQAYPQAYSQSVYIQGQTVPIGGENLLAAMCVRQTVGIFSLISQVSPTGGFNLDDLAILDPNDPKQWLLVVAQPRGEDVVIYRKLYQAP